MVWRVGLESYRRSDWCRSGRGSEYDAKGNRTSETDPLGRVSQYEYDERNRLFRQTLPGEGRVTIYGFDAVDNRADNKDRRPRPHL
jgi:YD repeat-containing protein